MLYVERSLRHQCLEKGIFTMMSTKVIPDENQQTRLRVANESFLLCVDEAFSNIDNVRTALMTAWDAIEILIDEATFESLVKP